MCCRSTIFANLVLQIGIPKFSKINFNAPPHGPLQVASMRQELEELQPKLVTAQEENAKMMVIIEKENIEVEARSKVVKKDEEVANEKAAEAQALKDEVMMMS